ncbi:beta-lactamase/transpeptidase-like protein [Phaeosphaeriaceae sp. PMI808]|nr:beta-lactamase/transpeptidase-like protein [Phaeosphaeriaceae sp. PMI808]
MEEILQLHTRSQTLSTPLIQDTISNRLGRFDDIRQVTKQPGLSIGVVFDGEPVAEHHFGVKDIDSQAPPNSNTLFSIASLTKAFITSSIGILVSEGKTSWDATVCSILPDFAPKAKSPDLKAATLRVNALPVRGTFRGSFEYNNALYGVAGRVIEKLASVDSWADFVQGRILRPLEMHDTTALDIDVDHKDIATPYTANSDGSLFKEPFPALSGTSINGGSGGMKSTVADISKWCVAITDAFKFGDAQADTQKRWVPSNPIKELQLITSAHTIVDSEFPSDEHYCLGWFRQTTPARFGLISPNRSLRSPVLGKESCPLTVYSHQGDVPGYTCSLYIIPEATFAVFALSNGTGLSDCTDWVCQDLVQELFGLMPAFDFLQEAKLAAEDYKTKFDRTLYQPYLEAKGNKYRPPTVIDFEGLYILQGCDFRVDISQIELGNRLVMVVNKRPNQRHSLHPFRVDQWCFMPNNLDEYLQRGYGLFDRMDNFVLIFHRNGGEKIKSFT